MQVLVDGNNLMFALRDEGVDAGREKVCRLLGEFAERTGLSVSVVFDGPAPLGDLAEQISDSRAAVFYAAPRAADEVICELIAEHTAPRRLSVVSTDHTIVSAARRRRCRSIRSEQFARRLLSPQPGVRQPDEPQAKQTGLDEGQVDEWLKELGLDE